MLRLYLRYAARSATHCFHYYFLMTMFATHLALLCRCWRSQTAKPSIGGSDFFNISNDCMFVCAHHEIFARLCVPYVWGNWPCGGAPYLLREWELQSPCDGGNMFLFSLGQFCFFVWMRAVCFLCSRLVYRVLRLGCRFCGLFVGFAFGCCWEHRSAHLLQQWHASSPQ